MTVFELIGTEASNDWASRAQSRRIGLYTSIEKAQAKITEIKSQPEWRMDWSKFMIKEVEVL